jgi:hypothetical protein
MDREGGNPDVAAAASADVDPTIAGKLRQAVECLAADPWLAERLEARLAEIKVKLPAGAQSDALFDPMRFKSFTFEKYGRVDSCTLSFPPGPGLAVIYGPNGAGKSTSLAAIADFLFGIPHNSPQGQVFGYEQIRLTAVVALADGTRLSLRRRKGRAHTLTDECGKPVDEALLTRHLGSTGRVSNRNGRTK